LITEAGGCIEDIDGKMLDFSQGRTLRSNRGIFATNGYIHEEVKAAIKNCNNNNKI